MTFSEELTIQRVLNDACSSTWLKVSLLAAIDCDPVDAANDAGVLAHLLAKRCDEIFRTKSFTPPQEWGEQRQ